MHDEPFVPDTSLTEVDTAWMDLCNQNSEYFDGEIVHVLHVNRTGCGGAIVQCARTSFRFHAVGNLGITPLGVKGICKQDDKVLCGLRGKKMGVYPEQWEFAPAGLMEPNQKSEDIIARELEEETGLMLSSPPTAIALFFDEEAQTWEIVFKLAVIGTCHRDETEYESLGWFDINSMPNPMSPPALRMKSLL